MIVLTRTFVILLIVSFLASCQNAEKSSLPKIGFHDFVDGDTVYQKVAEFSFINQDSQVINNESFKDKIYLVDFFFISCPTICPKVTKQMLRIHNRYKTDDRLRLLAHTIDPKRDTVERLKQYATNLGVDHSKWWFVTGEKDELYGIADDYFSVATENPEAPGGFDHSGRIILVDWNGIVRSFANGTEPEDVDRLMNDIDILLKEYDSVYKKSE